MTDTITIRDQQTFCSSSRRNNSSVDEESLRIRKNLMLKLGVDTAAGASTRRIPSRGGSASLLGNVKLSTEPLKGNEQDESEDNVNILTNLVSFFTGSSSSSSSSKPSPPSSLSSSPEDADPSLALSSSVSESSSVSLAVVEEEEEDPPSRRLTFNEEVSVCPIPKREEYSKRIREHLWNSPQDMMMNCERNSIEFAAEGWDWRNSLEDEHMYRCVATNELIHPVHVEGYP